jgi:hypothetical protein
MPDMTASRDVQARKDQLVSEAQITLQAIRCLAVDGKDDPLTDPAVLARAVAEGILDAPHLRDSQFAPGKVVTRMVSGACQAVDGAGRPLSEAERLEAFVS